MAAGRICKVLSLPRLKMSSVVALVATVSLFNVANAHPKRCIKTNSTNYYPITQNITTAPVNSSMTNSTINDSNGHNFTTSLSDLLLTTSSTGAAHVINKCSFEVWSNIVHGPRPGVEGPPEEYPSMMKPESIISHPFRHDPNMGISWKIVRTSENGQISGPVQLEWTWSPEQNRTYYDLSMIDAHVDAEEFFTNFGGQESGTPTEMTEGIVHSFTDLGLSLALIANKKHVSKDEGGYNCVPVICPPNAPVCEQAYNYPEDWSKQHDCAGHVHLVMTLCG